MNMAKNVYQHCIDLKTIDVRNSSKEEFAKKLIELPYRGYEVERLSNGLKIVITKPGGKSIYGKPRKEDFLVFVYNPQENSLWQISHKQILEDIREKSKENRLATIQLIDLMEKTLQGEEPNDFLQAILDLKFQGGETPEMLIKVYKWIWGQEDVNYPNGEGRFMSWCSLDELRQSLK